MRNICIICALPQETGHLLAKFPRRNCGTLAGCKSWEAISASSNIIIIESGIGFENATKAVTAAILHYKPEFIINSGFCGALTADLHVGDIVAAHVISHLSQEAPGQAITVDATLNATLLKECITADFISTDSICSKSYLLKALSPAKTAVVDMETYAVASICNKHDIPFIAVRAVSDALDTDPGQFLRAITDHNFTIRLTALLCAVISKPSFLCQLFTLASGARTAGKSLAATLATVVEKI